ncbi:penicillin-binding protein activator [Marinobacterium sp. YM272]|uniref:penicillin-binding protein activator n=1 Tax=Marinobacterium sp. YM272 TaxID=3421654 RepID=UPI003D7FFBB2
MSTTRTISQGNDAEQLIARAESAPPIEAAELKLRAAEMLMRQQQTEQAVALLDSIDTRNLPPSLAFDITRLRVNQALEADDASRALSLLDTRALPSLSQPQQTELGELRAEAYSQQSQPLSAALELIAIANFPQSPEQKQAMHDRIWSLLQQAPSTELQQAARARDNGYYEQGWLELALASRDTRNLTESNDALSQWRTLWEDHPAFALPPMDLATPQIAPLHAGRIGLLLPLSGPLAEPARAISEGFYSAMMTSQQPNSAPDVVTIDSTRISTPAQLASLAQQQRLELIIGPLSRDYVMQLSQIQNFPLPILALNKATPGSALYQLELSSDQEARLVAERAWQDGHRRVALIVPDADWGKHLASSLTDSFTSLGGQVVETLAYQSGQDFSSQISQLLLTDRSAARAREVRRIIGQSIDFNERPRDDIDAILLTALPQDARQIKPMLAFHFAGDIPVYATSHIYEGTPDPMRDVDLNGIQFLDLPWVLNPPSEAHLALNQTRQDTDSRFGRLYALGIDAYRVFPYLYSLSQSPGAYIEGETGQLSLDNQRQVKRALPWAVFSDGVPRVQPAKTLESTQQNLPMN